MKKFITPVPSGGAPLHHERLNDVLGAEIWDAIQGLMARYDSDTEGAIVKGCVLAANASNFDITAGMVYLNGEFMRLAASTNQTFPKYIAPKTVSYIQKEFGDNVLKNLIEVKEAELVGSAPGSGQYIAITSLTASRRFDELDKFETIEFLIDGGGATIGTGIQGVRAIPFDCVITNVEAYADTTGSVAVDLWVKDYANYPATNSDSITASAPVTISSGVKSNDSTLTGWSKTLTKGTHMVWNVDSVTNITRLTIVIRVRLV